MSIEKIKEIEAFLSDYREIKRKQAADVEDFKRRFTSLALAFQQKREETHRLARKEAPGFNVFDVLRLSRDEARTHSAFLAHLLSPRALHGQGHLFLSAFLDRCSELDEIFPKLPIENVEAVHWHVETEVSIPGSRMDIVLRCPDLGFLCVIENKIDASEQYRQLARYQKWMDTQAEAYPRQVLIYLTIRGDVSITAEENKPYPRLSYHNDINAWLVRTLEKIQPIKVREVVQQYIELVEKL